MKALREEVFDDAGIDGADVNGRCPDEENDGRRISALASAFETSFSDEIRPFKESPIMAPRVPYSPPCYRLRNSQPPR